MHSQSSRVALGGIFSALCVVLLFMTGMFPFSTYWLPALAGAMLAVVVVENGTKAAWTVYAAVSLLSVFIVPDREAALLFILFLGYYAIIKEKIERLRPRLLEYGVKLALFNLMVIIAYFVLAYIFGITELMEEMAEYGKYAALVLLLMANGVFLIYDFALTRYISLYVHWLRPKILRNK